MPDIQRLESLPVHPHPEPVPDYRLEVSGLVERPLSLTTEDLREMPQEEIFDEFACLEGWSVPGLRWRAQTGRRAGCRPRWATSACRCRSPMLGNHSWR